MPIKTPSDLPSSPHTHEVDRIIRLKEFLQLTGLGRSTVYKLIADHVLDRPIQIGVRAVGWRSSYINEFLNSRPVAGA